LEYKKGKVRRESWRERGILGLATGWWSGGEAKFCRSLPYVKRVCELPFTKQD